MACFAFRVLLAGGLVGPVKEVLYRQRRCVRVMPTELQGWLVRHNKPYLERVSRKHELWITL